MPAPRGTDLCYPCKRVERTEHGETHGDTLPADERLALVLGGFVFRALLLTSWTLACGSVVAQDRTFDFALIGDMPYTKVQEREYQRVLEALNAADLAFVAHIGDFQFDARPYNQNPAIASMPCVDDNYKAILSSFQSVRHPFILTPGDNDWTDCWPLQAQKVDPMELLAKVRTMSFPRDAALGRSRSR